METAEQKALYTKIVKMVEDTRSGLHANHEIRFDDLQDWFPNESEADLTACWEKLQHEKVIVKEHNEWYIMK